MIKSLHLKNFFSFDDQLIQFSNLNALIGVNGVGKSNLIKAIQVLKAVATEGELPNLIINKWGGFDAIHFCGADVKDANCFIELEYEFESDILGKYGYKFKEPVFYRIRFYKVASSKNFSICESLHTKDDEGHRGYIYLKMDNGKGFAREGRPSDQSTVSYIIDDVSGSLLNQLVDKDRYFQIFTIREAIKDISIYNYFDTTATSPIRKPVQPSNSNRLFPDGANLPQVLNSIKVNSKSSYSSIIKALRSINPNFKGIDFNFLGTNIELLLEEENLEKSIHVTHISDGTLRFLCLLAVIFNTNRGCLICIDEPEVGLHPDMMEEIMSAIISTYMDSQYIISTHSEHILNQLSVKNVRVFEKDDSNSTVVKNYEDSEFVEWASQYSTGKLWRNGDLGGNRY